LREAGIKLDFSITIPDRLAWPFVAAVLLYRRIRYGYPFRRITLTQGKYAIVDPEDFERLNKHKWFANSDGRTYYACRNSRKGKKRIQIKMHREIINPPDHLVVDHINYNGIDNRKANLRQATRSQNNMNKPIFKTKAHLSRYKGVTWNKRSKKWQVLISYNRRRKFLGCFEDEIAAAKAYDEAAKKHHKEFAVLNFPNH
jgi:hypothetical protein